MYVGSCGQSRVPGVLGGRPGGGRGRFGGQRDREAAARPRHPVRVTQTWRYFPLLSESATRAHWTQLRRSPGGRCGWFRPLPAMARPNLGWSVPIFTLFRPTWGLCRLNEGGRRPILGRFDRIWSGIDHCWVISPNSVVVSTDHSSAGEFGRVTTKTMAKRSQNMRPSVMGGSG